MLPSIASASMVNIPIKLQDCSVSNNYYWFQIFCDQAYLKHCEDSGPTANSSNTSQFYQFSFAGKRPEDVRPQEDIRSCIKNFERETKTDVDLEASNSYYDAEEYSIQGHMESLLFDRVLYNRRIESGGLLLCGGAISSLPFASVMWWEINRQ